MTAILAHRGNVEGPCRRTENRPVALAAALARGWGLEIDIRRAVDGRFYVSHDAQPVLDEDDADQIWALVRRFPAAPVAVNVKELGYEEALLTYLDAQGVLGQSFLFDMELLEPAAGATAALLRRLHPAVCLAARVSDRGEPVERALAIAEASVVWLDEFEGPWAAEADVRRLRDAGRVVHAVSLDLHGFPLDAARDRWAELVAWGVEGICTDYPGELERVLAVPARQRVS